MGRVSSLDSGCVWWPGGCHRGLVACGQAKGGPLPDPSLLAGPTGAEEIRRWTPPDGWEGLWRLLSVWVSVCFRSERLNRSCSVLGWELRPQDD